MIRIVLSEEQLRAIEESTDDEVELVDHSGRSVGVATRGFTAEQIAEAERRARSGGPRYTTAEVLDYLNSLETE